MAILGAITRTYLLDTTIHKKYTIMMLNMNARHYAIADFFYSSFKQVVSTWIICMLLGLFLKIPMGICLLIPIFSIACKVILLHVILTKYKKSRIYYMEKNAWQWIVTVICLAGAFALPVDRKSVV